MPTLSAQQLSVLQYHANAGDRIAYYTALSSFGFAYGGLALGIVLNNTVSGAAANSFFIDQAGTVTENQLATISKDLMLADLTARVAVGGAGLSVDAIQGYHAQVFASDGKARQIVDGHAQTRGDLYRVEERGVDVSAMYFSSVPLGIPALQDIPLRLPSARMAAATLCRIDRSGSLASPLSSILPLSCAWNGSPSPVTSQFASTPAT